MEALASLVGDVVERKLILTYTFLQTGVKSFISTALGWNMVMANVWSAMIYKTPVEVGATRSVSG